MHSALVMSEAVGYNKASESLACMPTYIITALSEIKFLPNMHHLTHICSADADI
jgi:hypothetical protein